VVAFTPAVLFELAGPLSGPTVLLPPAGAGSPQTPAVAFTGPVSVAFTSVPLTLPNMVPLTPGAGIVVLARTVLLPSLVMLSIGGRGGHGMEPLITAEPEAAGRSGRVKTVEPLDSGMPAGPEVTFVLGATGDEVMEAGAGALTALDAAGAGRAKITTGVRAGVRFRPSN
jgi:hypothetical protein